MKRCAIESAIKEKNKSEIKHCERFRGCVHFIYIYFKSMQNMHEGKKTKIISRKQTFFF